MQQLSLEVRQLHAVRVDDPQPTDAGSHEVQRRWGTKATSADDKHGCLPETLLSCHADAGQRQLSCVAVQLARAELRWG